MKRLALGVVAVAMAFAFTGCNDNSDNPDQKANLDGHYTVGDITVNGKPLTCVTLERGAGQSKWGGLSCDWVAYHQQPEVMP
jgi:hypothetical protein